MVIVLRKNNYLQSLFRFNAIHLCYLMNFLVHFNTEFNKDRINRLADSYEFFLCKEPICTNVQISTSKASNNFCN